MVLTIVQYYLSSFGQHDVMSYHRTFHILSVSLFTNRPIFQRYIIYPSGSSSR